jgi:hypothetical protein
VRQDHDIAGGKPQRRSVLDRDTQFAFLNHMDASRPALKFDVEPGPQFGCQHALSAQLNEPQNVGKKIGVWLQIGRWSKNSVVAVMGFQGGIL